MILPADYHMHTPLCRHAVGAPSELAARARKLGFTEIGFSDHSPMRRDDFDDWRMLDSELDTYVALVQKARRGYRKLTIKLGLEVDYLPGGEDWVRSLAARHSWDFLIGSVHYIEGPWAIDSPFQMSEWEKRDPLEVWSSYFDRLTAAAESGLFDIIGHADLPKKFCFYPKQDCTPIFKRFIKAAARHNVAIELNTAGLRKSCKEIYPSPQIVRLAVEAGVPITFGSDAHSPEEVGAGFAEAVELLRSCGGTHWARFTGRKRELVALS